MKPIAKRLCIVLWVLWVAIGAVWALLGLTMNAVVADRDVVLWLIAGAITGFPLLLLQYLLTGLWRPTDLLK